MAQGSVTVGSVRGQGLWLRRLADFKREKRVFPACGAWRRHETVDLRIGLIQGLYLRGTVPCLRHAVRGSLAPTGHEQRFICLQNAEYAIFVYLLKSTVMQPWAPDGCSPTDRTRSAAAPGGLKSGPGARTTRCRRVCICRFDASRFHMARTVAFVAALPAVGCNPEAPDSRLLAAARSIRRWTTPAPSANPLALVLPNCGAAQVGHVERRIAGRCRLERCPSAV